MNAYDTDKIESGLIAEYEKLFAGLKGKPIKYLEIGIWRGGSLRWAQNFFGAQSEVFGIDIDVKKQIDGARLFQADQNNSEQLEKVAAEIGLLDIIIDDGSHERTPTRKTFETFFKRLKPDGFYVIEDWTAFFTHGEAYKGTTELMIELGRKFSCQMIVNPTNSLAIFRNK